MTGSELKTFTESLNGGYEMEDTLFYNLLNMARTIVEGLRPWRFLLTEDSTSSAATSDTYTTMKTLPATFGRPYPRTPIRLVAADGTYRDYNQPVAFADRHINKSTAAGYYFDFANSQYALTGSVDRAYTIYLYYLKRTTAISSATSWTFPSEYHPILGYFVAAMNKGGIDYDDVFARMAPENRSQAQALLDTMIAWDDDLQRAEINV